MGDNRSASVNLGDYTKVDGESELHGGTFLQTQVGCFDEHAIGAEIAGPTELARPAWNGNVNRGAGTVARIQASFHSAKSCRVGLEKGALIMQFATAEAKFFWSS
jgi:hypothetical protein